MIRRRWIILTGAGFACVGLMALALQIMMLPTTLKVAAGPLNSEDVRLIAAITQVLNRDRAAIRLKLVLTEGPTSSAAALDRGEVDLAAVRSDEVMPVNGQTMTIIRRNAALLIAPEASKIKDVPDLAKHTIGIIPYSPVNVRLLETVLAQYELGADDVKKMPLNVAEAASALRTGKVQAVLTVGSLTGRLMNDVVTAISRYGDIQLTFLPILDAEAIAQRSPAFEAVEIVRGAFGGAPPKPAESMATLGFSHRLVADRRLDEDTVSALTELIFSSRAAIAADHPSATHIEAPDTEKGSSLPVHPGAAAYLDGEQMTFMDRYGDWFYIGVMVLSVFGSGAAALMSYANAGTRKRAAATLERLLEMMMEARRAGDEQELDRLDDEADALSAQVLRRASDFRGDDSGLMAFSLALSQARQAIAERRRVLRQGSGKASEASDPVSSVPERPRLSTV